MKNTGKAFTGEQEKFWAGEFGNDYIGRNQDAQILAGKIALFAKALRLTHGIGSAFEIGANIGLNLVALKHLFPALSAAAVEINAEAYARLSKLDFVKAHHGSIHDFTPAGKFDLVLSCGVMIHLDPERLPDTYRKLYDLSSRYVLVAEYYNPTPVSIPYRGANDKLFKRDFAGEMLDMFPSLKLVDYGFAYRRDPNHPLDDINWFLLEKTDG
jgi:pseudaminic acid biosynthesis-associated methylase